METETPTYAANLAAFDAAQAALAATPTADLLRTAYRLTHQLDGARSNLTRPDRVRRYRDLRQQRDMIDAELIRRADR